MKRFGIVLLFLIYYKGAFSQNIPLDQQVQKRFNEIWLESDTSFFTGFRSANWLEYKSFLTIKNRQLTDSAFGLSMAEPEGYFFKHLATNNWIQAGKKNSIFAVDPYIGATFGAGSNKDGSNFQGDAGLHLQGVVNDKFSYSLAYVYSYVRMPGYLRTYTENNQGYALGMGAGTLSANNAHRFSNLTGDLTYTPNKHFLVSIGNGKNFIGDGYRSLILSDNASNYPYARVQFRYWKLTYNIVYAKLSNPRFNIDGATQDKYSAMHYLGINFSKKFQLGFFDNVIWYVKDTNVTRRFDVQYLNPIIFMRPVEARIGSPDNAFMGLTAKYKLYKNGFLYGQLALDDVNLTVSFRRHTQVSGNKYALQLGIWNKDLFNINGLSWRLEWNGVRPYTYGHGFGKIGLNYTTANQTLADPYGANFHEFISIFQYNHERWYGLLENMFTIRGENPGVPYNNGEDLWGGDFGIPKFGVRTLQGIKNKYFYNQLSIGYLLNPRDRLALEANMVFRRHSAPHFSESVGLFSIGLKTGLYNFYKDF